MAAQQRQGSQRSKHHMLIGLLATLILSIGISQIILAEKAITLSSNPISISKQQKEQNTDAIVYLAQFSKVHSTYGAQHDIENNTISGNSKLSKSLDLLYSNYINHFPTNVDVIIFYVPEEGVPTNETMEELQLANRPQIKLHPLNSTYWSLPYNLHESDSIHWNRPMYSIGYRHMMRWFAILIWPYLHNLGYTHVMRLDDDSYIHSQIKYNLFEYMRDNHKVYGFRQPVIEDAVGVGWDDMVDKVLDVNKDVTTQELVDEFKKDRRISFYNNFFIADISFFIRPPASTFLNLIDESNLIYTQRTGDLVVHSTVVRLLLPPERIHWFRDFSYQHMTLCTNPKCGHGVVNGCPQNGGLSRGVGTYTNEEWSAITGDLKVKVEHDKKVVERGDPPYRKCLWFIRYNTYIGAKDVMKCLKRKERCYPYLKQFLNSSEAAETSKFIPS
ncbi:alpha-1,2-mannosyltransferase [Skeletonema marinoi]|uniref:Alpha-1,2-mannosyltransferase n=1 Tax=Skeletonema marinoi TaxID=267567 RepID=A0AAD9D3P3_9STRA|nr:alpha-1,2-mannosyltransferase [Skeletonema marinoi]